MALRVEQLSLGPMGTNCYVVRTDATASRGRRRRPERRRDGAPAAHSRRLGTRLRRHPRHARALGPPPRRRRPRGGHRAKVYMADGERFLLETPPAVTPPTASRCVPTRPTSCSPGARRSRSPGSTSRSSPCPGTRRRTSRTTPTAACSPATSCSRARSAAPTSPGRTGRRFCRSIRMLVETLPRGHGRLPRARPASRRSATSSRGIRSSPSSARSARA